MRDSYKQIQDNSAMAIGYGTLPTGPASFIMGVNVNYGVVQIS
jgi:hypothetical protein